MRKLGSSFLVLILLVVFLFTINEHYEETDASLTPEEPISLSETKIIF